MKIKLDQGARMPLRVHRQDAGLDLHSMEIATIFPGESWTFDTGVHIAFDPGTYGKIESKSGLNVKNDIVSCGGVIDEGFVGSIRVKLYNLGHEAYTFYPGDKVAQLVIMPYLAPEIELVEALDDTERGVNGFGSSGR